MDFDLFGLDMVVGEAYRLPRAGIGLKKAELSWNTSDEEVIFISDRGLLTARGTGTARLTVTMEEGKQASVGVRVLES